MSTRDLSARGIRDLVEDNITRLEDLEGGGSGSIKLFSGEDLSSHNSITAALAAAVQEFSFYIPDGKPGDLIAMKFGRVGGDVADTFTGVVEVGIMEATGIAWTV